MEERECIEKKKFLNLRYDLNTRLKDGWKLADFRFVAILYTSTVELRYNRLAYNVSSVIAYASSRSCHFSIQNVSVMRTWI